LCPRVDVPPCPDPCPRPILFLFFREPAGGFRLLSMSLAMMDLSFSVKQSCYTSSTRTRWMTLRIIPRICGVSFFTTE